MTGKKETTREQVSSSQLIRHLTRVIVYNNSDICYRLVVELARAISLK